MGMTIDNLYFGHPIFIATKEWQRRKHRKVRKRMIKETIFCDRCGKECKDDINNRGYHIFRKWILAKPSNNDYLDLCQKCYDELYDWMKLGRKKVDNENND